MMLLYCRRSVLAIAALLAIGATSVGMLQIQAFQCQKIRPLLHYHQHHGSSSSSQPQRRIERTNTVSSCITSRIATAAPALLAHQRQEDNEDEDVPEPWISRSGWGRWRRQSRQQGIIVLDMTTPNDPPPPLFQEMPTNKKKSITSSTTRPTVAAKASTTNLLFQDQAKPLRIENNSVVVSAAAVVVDPLVATAVAAPGRSSSSSTTTRATAVTTTTPYYYYAVGDVVRVVVPNLRGYQVPAAGRGRYERLSGINKDNNDRSVVVFVPDPTLKYLILPIGLQGTVEKVYDDNNVLSANLPIRVSFVVAVAAADDDDDTQRPPQPPVDFSMHFAASELELVTPAAAVAAVPEES